ncbi:MAG: uroporphyrinogen-III synthase [Chitinophagaceae bacterium]
MSKAINILCTRKLDAKVLKKAELNNIHINCVPFIETIFTQSSDVENKVKELETQEIVAVFTSKKAVEGVIGLLTTVPNWKIFCTGGITKNSIIKYFGEDHIVESGKHASDVKQKILKRKSSILKVYFFCGDQRMNDIPESLPTQGIQVEEMVVYKTILLPQYIDKDYDGIMFFSPSAAHSYFSENTLPTETPLFSIGNTTTATIKTYSANPIITSEWPGQESLANLVIQHFSNLINV